MTVSRVEEKLDRLIEDFGDFRVHVTERLVKIEVTLGVEDEVEAKEVSHRQFKWMRYGIYSSVGIAILSFIKQTFWR